MEAYESVSVIALNVSVRGFKKYEWNFHLNVLFRDRKNRLNQAKDLSLLGRD